MMSSVFGVRSTKDTQWSTCHVRSISHTKYRQFWSHLIIAMLLYNLPSDVALLLRNYLSLSAPGPPTSYDLAFATGSHAAYFGFVLNTTYSSAYSPLSVTLKSPRFHSRRIRSIRAPAQRHIRSRRHELPTPHAQL